MQTMAIDTRVPGIPVAQLRDVAVLLHLGKCRLAVPSDFVHVRRGAHGAGSCASDLGVNAGEG